MNKLLIDSMYLKKPVKVVFNDNYDGRIETEGVVKSSFNKGFILVQNSEYFKGHPQQTMRNVLFSDLISIEKK